MALHVTNDDTTIAVVDSDLDVPNGDPETSYTIRLLTREVMKDAIKRHTTRARQRTGQMVTEVDWPSVNDDLFDYALVGWQGVLWNGEPAPCERSLKLRIDILRQQALLEQAGMSQVSKSDAEVRSESFRATP